MRMELVGVRVEVAANTPVVLLREQEGRHRILPILIGSPEASAIHMALEGISAPRPMTHDLIVNLLASTDVELRHVVVTEIVDHTFFAELHLHQGDRDLVVSSRPSDALAVAARTGAPIFAADELLDAVGVESSDDVDEHEEEALLDEFRDFLEEIKPEDFE
jgi:bifunctional DNase/RNase